MVQVHRQEKTQLIKMVLVGNRHYSLKLGKTERGILSDLRLPYAGGLAIIASTLNATLLSGSGSMHAGSKEYMISFI